LEEAGLTDLQVRPQDFSINEFLIEADILIEGKKTVLKVIEPVKIPHDIRFLRKRNALEENRLLLQGDDKYTLAKQILQGYQEAQLNPITLYCIKYYKGLNFKLIDSKKAKDEAYLRHVVQLL
jgi:hypothetical protein